MANSGALMMGVNPVPPIEPSELKVKQPPDMRSSGRPLVRARSDTSAISVAISGTDFKSASRMTGTSKPPGVSTAMPI